MPLDAGMQPVVDWFWTCAGKALAYRNDDALFPCEGIQIAYFKGDEIYDREGNYLGEIGRNGRLITHLNKPDGGDPDSSPKEASISNHLPMPTGEC
jgi:4-fold beta flower protein